MTIYTIYKDHIEMVHINKKRHFFHSDEDLQFIISTLVTDFLLLIADTSSRYRSRFIRCYYFLFDIQKMLHTSITSSHHVINLVRDILVFMPQRSFKILDLSLKINLC